MILHQTLIQIEIDVRTETMMKPMRRNSTLAALVVGTVAVWACLAPSVMAGPEETAIERVVSEHARALTEFVTEREIRFILKYFANDYTGVTDGQWQTLKDVQKDLLEWDSRMDDRETLGLSYRVTDITVHLMAEASAWGTYDFTLQVLRDRRVVETGKGRCTTIFRKEAGEWLFQHSHCSSAEGEEPPKDTL